MSPEASFLLATNTPTMALADPVIVHDPTTPPAVITPAPPTITITPTQSDLVEGVATDSWDSYGLGHHTLFKDMSA